MNVALTSRVDISSLQVSSKQVGSLRKEAPWSGWEHIRSDTATTGEQKRDGLKPSQIDVLKVCTRQATQILQSTITVII